MKTKLLLLGVFIGFSQVFTAQSITFTSTLTEAQIGTTITVNYEYTIPADGNIYCVKGLAFKDKKSTGSRLQGNTTVFSKLTFFEGSIFCFLFIPKAILKKLNFLMMNQ